MAKVEYRVVRRFSLRKWQPGRRFGEAPCDRSLPKPLKKSIVAAAVMEEDIFHMSIQYLYINISHGGFPIGQIKNCLQQIKDSDYKVCKNLLSQNYRIPLLVLLLSVSKVIAFKTGVSSNWGYHEPLGFTAAIN